MAEAITSSVIPFELESENQKDKIKEITDKLEDKHGVIVLTMIVFAAKLNNALFRSEVDND